MKSTTKEKIRSLLMGVSALVIVASTVLSMTSCSFINSFVEGFKEGFNAAFGGDESGSESELPSQTPEASESEDVGSVEAPDFDFMGEDLTPYVTLGQYKDFEIEVEPMPAVTDNDVMAQIKYDLINSKLFETVTDRAVTKDDTVSISYKGLMDGEEFEGGTGDKDFFTIYNGGGFIDGFADGIIGAMPGTEVAVELTFPEDYYEDLAGKPVTFMVTVKHIYEAKELTDAVASELTGNDDMTKDALIKNYREKMEASVKEAYNEYKINLTWEKIFNAAEELELPKDLVDGYYNVDVQYYKTYAAMYGMSYEDILEMVGLTEDEVYARAHDNVLTDMIVYSVIKAEGYYITDDEYTEMLDELVESTGYKKEDLVETYTEKGLKDMFTYTKVYEMAVDWQSYTVVEKAE